MWWHTRGSRACDISLPKICNGEEKSESSVGQERDPGDYYYGDAEVKGGLAYGFLRIRKNTAGVAKGRKKGEDGKEQ